MFVQTLLTRTRGTAIAGLEDHRTEFEHEVQRTGEKTGRLRRRTACLQVVSPDGNDQSEEKQMDEHQEKEEQLLVRAC